LAKSRFEAVGKQMGKTTESGRTNILSNLAILLLNFESIFLASLEVAREICTDQITQWKAQLLEGAAGVFNNGARRREPAVDLKALQAKIGELTLEKDLLEGALGKAGVLSAKR
jgi:transposase